MGNSYVCHHVHIVFTTKRRERLIAEDLQPKLWAYIAGIAQNYGMDALAIGGTDDHIHALINLGATLGIAKAVQVLKANSSRWMNQSRRTRFEWQEGYFACSVSRSQISSVVRYIANQKSHHQRINSAAEFLLFLKRHGFESREDVMSQRTRERCSLLFASRHSRAGLFILSSLRDSKSQLQRQLNRPRTTNLVQGFKGYPCCHPFGI